MIKQVALFCRSVSYTRPTQLAARLRLLVKRKVLAGCARWYRASPHAVLRGASVDELLSDDLPVPLFPARTELVEGAGSGLCFRLLNQRFPVTIPHNWHDPALEHGTRLEKLHLHYMEYLEAIGDEEFSELVEDWIARNRPYRPGYWLDCWNSYALSIRCVVWMQQYAVRRGRIASSTGAALLRSLLEQIRFLCGNLETDIGGNHLVKNIKALLWAGRFFRGAEAQAWQELGERLLAQELDQQILSDGMHFERSPAYHFAVFSDFLECFQVIPDGSQRDRLAAVLHRMAQAAVQLTHPDGLVSLFGDGGLHMTYSLGDCLAVYGHLTGRTPSLCSVIELPRAGYFGLRQDNHYFLGNFEGIIADSLPAHAHGDVFSFEWDLAGRRLIVDPGVYEYHPGPSREYARSTRAHNTVTVDDQDQSEFWKAFRVGDRARVSARVVKAGRRRLLLDAVHDGYRRLPGRPIHRRRIWTDARRIVVRDSVQGGKGQRVRARLLCHPECIVQRMGDKVLISGRGVGARLETKHSVTFEDAWWMPDFGVRQPARRIVIDYGTAPCEGAFFLVGHE
jgi:uncharacterized heparinase superfamily protein